MRDTKLKIQGSVTVCDMFKIGNTNKAKYYSKKKLIMDVCQN